MFLIASATSSGIAWALVRALSPAPLGSAAAAASKVACGLVTSGRVALETVGRDEGSAGTATSGVGVTAGLAWLGLPKLNASLKPCTAVCIPKYQQSAFDAWQSV